MFLQDKDKSIRLIDGPDAKLLKQVTPGIYSLEIQESIFGNTVQLIPTERYNKDFNVTSGVYEKVINYVNAFIDPVMEETRREMGKLNKLGLIFNGLPGSGKTFTAGQIAYHLVKNKKAVCLVVKGTQDSYEFAALVDQIREYDPNRFVVLILDEFEKDRCRTNLLGFLDGVNSRDNMLIIGTTNSIKELPNWVTERPSRFERIFEFTIADKDVFEQIVNALIPEQYQGKLNIDELHKIAIENNMTIDAITIEVTNALYRYKKALVDPNYLLSNPYDYITDVLNNPNTFEDTVTDVSECNKDSEYYEDLEEEFCNKDSEY